MGAQGVQMGTAFLLAEECTTHPRYKQRILEGVDTDTVVTGFLRGHAVRGLKNAFSEKYLQLERSGAPTEELDRLAAETNWLAIVKGDLENGFVQAGQSIYHLKETRPARLIIEEIVGDATELLRKAPDLVS